MTTKFFPGTSAKAGHGEREHYQRYRKLRRIDLSVSLGSAGSHCKEHTLSEPMSKYAGNYCLECVFCAHNKS